MNLQKLTIQILAATVGCFALSYGASVMGGINSKDAFPKSVGNLYANVTNPLVQVNFEKSLSTSSISEVEVDSTSYEIHLSQIDGENIQLKFKGRVPADNVQEPFEIETEGGRVIIRPVRKKKHGTFYFGFDNGEGHMDLALPKKLGRLEVRTVSGDVRMESFALSRLDLKSVSGDVSMEATSCDEMKVASVSGDVTVTGTVQNLTVTSVSGDVKAQLDNEAPHVELRTTSGDGTVKFKTKPNLHLDFSTISGDLTVDPEFGHVSSSGRKFSSDLGDGKGYLSVKTISGDVKVGRF